MLNKNLLLLNIDMLGLDITLNQMKYVLYARAITAKYFHLKRCSFLLTMY